ncbi:hypothetical protein [Anoxybacillus sp. KU2-6(11)]|uniref:hypothetical protein n=1 Tax=Anoxybacillus sp. KU2-6(11) TaxID=1535751 RepID=UPI001E3A6173|nr:hypothetical protein [Anoxybacillus sp. KU2-6(11)]
MRMFEETLKKLFMNYTIGSILAVVGVGSTLMVMALNIRQVDLLMLFLIQFFFFLLYYVIYRISCLSKRYLPDSSYFF